MEVEVEVVVLTYIQPVPDRGRSVKNNTINNKQGKKEIKQVNTP